MSADSEHQGDLFTSPWRRWSEIAFQSISFLRLLAWLTEVILKKSHANYLDFALPLTFGQRLGSSSSLNQQNTLSIEWKINRFLEHVLQSFQETNEHKNPVTGLWSRQPSPPLVIVIDRYGNIQEIENTTAQLTSRCRIFLILIP